MYDGARAKAWLSGASGHFLGFGLGIIPRFVEIFIGCLGHGNFIGISRVENLVLQATGEFWLSKQNQTALPSLLG